MRLRLIVATRLGIGMNRRSFYRRHIAILAATTLPGMAAQTDRDFEWVIGVDIRIDAESWAELEALLAPWPHFRAVKVDPFVHDMAPVAAVLMPDGPGDDELIGLSRLDDDDAVATDMVARIRAAALKPGALYPMSIALSNGLQVDPDDGRFAPARVPSIAIGLTIVSRAAKVMEIYGHSHKRVAETVAKKGGEGVVLEADHALWLHVRGAASDSGEVLPRIKLPKPEYAADDAKATADILEPALAACGLSRDWIDTVRRLRAELPDVGVDITWDPPVRRTQIKGVILRAHRVAVSHGWPTDSLECVFYLV